MIDPDHPPIAPALTPPRLSKSKFLAGLQCSKRLYLEVHHPQLATLPDDSTRSMLAMGIEIGEMARRRFHGGVLVTPGFRQREAAVAETAALLQDRTVRAIFEGAFLYDGVLVRADILERVTSPDESTQRWRLIEVKSSTRVKEVHLADLAIQSHVLLGAGLALDATFLMRINNEYVYAGQELDLNALFVSEDVTEAVANHRLRVAERIVAMRTSLWQHQPPLIEPSLHCHAPHECPFWDHCTKDKPGRWIYYLPGSTQIVSRLAEDGILTIDEIPDGTLLSPVQRRVKSNVEWVSDKLLSVLRSVRYPVHHLDFETVMLAIPRFSSTSPYQAVPVQWSNHIEDESGEIVHQEFLHQDAGEPRRRWAEALIESLGERGSICVYSSYERAIMEQLIETFPEYRAPFQQIIKRLWDLFPVIRNHYYHPAFRGSYSIKAVVPAIVPSLAYEDLAIQDGGQAAAEYYRMAFIETDWIERASIREALLKYCERDTMAMVQLRRVLAEKATLAGRLLQG